MKFILFGPQGVGKGTYGVVLSKKYKIPLLGTGEIFRKAIKEKTKIGKIAEKYIHEGNLVPDEITADIVKERIKKPDCENGYILDGFPRTLKQAKLFDDEMKKLDFIFELDAPEDLLIHRLTGRRLCRECGEGYNIHLDCAPNPKVPNKCDRCGGELY